MKKLLLPVAVCCFVQISSAQPFTGSNPLDIHVNASNPADLGLLIQGNTGAIGALGVEGNAAGTVYCLAGTVANNMIMGVLNSDGTGPSAINIDYQNHVGINTLNTSNYLFNCNGTAIFEQVTVKASLGGNNPKATPWADYVFDRNYPLPSLQSVADYIRTNRHLPGVPTYAEVQKNGIDLGATQARFLEKIEQLTLYTIDLQQQVDSLRSQSRQIGELQKDMETMKAENKRLADLVKDLISQNTAPLPVHK